MILRTVSNIADIQPCYITPAIGMGLNNDEFLPFETRLRLG